MLPDLPGPVVVRDHEVPLPRQGLEVRAEGLWAELWCETPLEHWTYGLEAFGVRLDDPADALGAGEAEIGERIPIGLDVEWEIAGPSHARPSGWPVAGVVQSGIVHGEVLLGRARFELDARGERRHTWGVRDWFGRSAWSFGLHGDDLTAHATAVARTGVDGFTWRGGQSADEVVDARVETHRRADRLPVAARYVVRDSQAWEAVAEVLGLAPVQIRDPSGGRVATLARAVCRYTVGDDTAVGWSSWLTPPS